MVKDKGYHVYDSEYDIVDFLQKGQYKIINVQTDFKVLSDPLVFANREVLLNNRLIKDFLSALEIKMTATKKLQEQLFLARSSNNPIQISLNQVQAANDRLAKTFVDDVEKSNRKLAKGISHVSFEGFESLIDVPRIGLAPNLKNRSRGKNLTVQSSIEAYN